jgi:DNA processing protein
VWSIVTDDPISFDEIVVKSQLPTAMVSSILLQLELLELVNQLPGMRYQR